MRLRNIGVILFVGLLTAALSNTAYAAATCTTFDAQSIPSSTFRGGERIVVRGTGFGPNSRVLVSLQQGTRTVELAGTNANDLGAFALTDATIPGSVAEGEAVIRAIDARGSATCPVRLEATAAEDEEGMSGLFWVWGAMLALFAFVLGALTYRRWKAERLKEAVDSLAWSGRDEERPERGPRARSSGGLLEGSSARPPVIAVQHTPRALPPTEHDLAIRGSGRAAPRPAYDHRMQRDAGSRTGGSFGTTDPPYDDVLAIGAPRPFDDRFLADEGGRLGEGGAAMGTARFDDGVWSKPEAPPRSADVPAIPPYPDVRRAIFEPFAEQEERDDVPRVPRASAAGFATQNIATPDDPDEREPISSFHLADVLDAPEDDDSPSAHADPPLTYLGVPQPAREYEPTVAREDEPVARRDPIGPPTDPPPQETVEIRRAAAPDAREKSFAEALREFLDAEDLASGSTDVPLRPEVRPRTRHDVVPRGHVRSEPAQLARPFERPQPEVSEPPRREVSEPPPMRRLGTSGSPEPFRPQASEQPPLQQRPPRSPAAHDEPGPAAYRPPEPVRPIHEDTGGSAPPVRPPPRRPDPVSEPEDVPATPYSAPPGPDALSYHPASEGAPPVAPDRAPPVPPAMPSRSPEPAAAAFDPVAAPSPRTQPRRSEAAADRAEPGREPPHQPSVSKPRRIERAVPPTTKRAGAEPGGLDEPPVLPVGWDDGRLRPAKRTSDAIARLRREVQDWKR